MSMMIVTMVRGRQTIKIAVTPSGKESLTKIAERYGMKEYVAGGKVFDWFLQQDDIFQRAVLGMMEGLEVDAARAFMERLVTTPRKRYRGDQVPPLKPKGRAKKPETDEPPARLGEG